MLGRQIEIYINTDILSISKVKFSDEDNDDTDRDNDFYLEIINAIIKEINTIILFNI